MVTQHDMLEYLTRRRRRRQNRNQQEVNAPAPVGADAPNEVNVPQRLPNEMNGPQRPLQRQLSESSNEGVGADDFEDQEIVLADDNFEDENHDFPMAPPPQNVQPQNDVPPPHEPNPTVQPTPSPATQTLANPTNQPSPNSVPKETFHNVMAERIEEILAMIKRKYKSNPPVVGYKFFASLNPKPNSNPFGEGCSSETDPPPIEPKYASPSVPLPASSKMKLEAPKSNSSAYVPLPDSYYTSNLAFPSFNMASFMGASAEKKGEKKLEKEEEEDDVEEDVNSTGDPDEELEAVVAELRNKWKQSKSPFDQTDSPAPNPKPPKELRIVLPKNHSSSLAGVPIKFQLLAGSILTKRAKQLANVPGQRGPGMPRSPEQLNLDRDTTISIYVMFAKLDEQLTRKTLNLPEFKAVYCDPSLTPYDIQQLHMREGIELGPGILTWINHLYGLPQEGPVRCVKLSDTFKGAQIPEKGQGYIVWDCPVPLNYQYPANFYYPGSCYETMVKRDKPRDHRTEPPNWIEIMQANDDPTLGEHPRAEQYPDYYSRTEIAYCEDPYWTERTVALPPGVKVPPRPRDLLTRRLAILRQSRSNVEFEPKPWTADCTALFESLKRQVGDMLEGQEEKKKQWMDRFDEETKKRLEEEAEMEKKRLEAWQKDIPDKDDDKTPKQ